MLWPCYKFPVHSLAYSKVCMHICNCVYCIDTDLHIYNFCRICIFLSVSESAGCNHGEDCLYTRIPINNAMPFSFSVSTGHFLSLTKDLQKHLYSSIDLCSFTALGKFCFGSMYAMLCCIMFAISFCILG